MASAIIFIRVSTSKQADSKNGLDAQREACEAYAKSNDLDVIETCVEAGVSGGAELSDRPGLMDAISSLKKGDVLLVAKRDRIARDVLNNAVIEKMVANKKASIVSADGAGNGDDAAAALMRNLLAAMAAYEKALASARTKAAMKAMKKAGKVYGKVPWGSRRDGNRLVADPGEMLLVQEVKVMRLEKRTWSSIAEQLNAAARFNRSGRPWSVQNLSQIVKRFEASC
tara:strand:+ start:1628 stop:2308 length:681 start_codon:yes stop_codon:yes gene_type:complete